MLHHEYILCEKHDSEKPVETIVLIHGFGGNHRIWKKQIPVLSQEYNVLAIDLPSHYKGNIKLSQMQVSLDAISREILKVLDHYGLKQCLFMGVSLGTVFVKYIEVYYPEYVSLGILVGTFARVNIILKRVTEFFAKRGDKLPFSIVYHIFSWIIMPRKDSKKSRDIFRDCAKALNKTEFKLYMKIFTQAFKFNDKFVKTKHTENIYISGEDDICFMNGAVLEAIKTKAKFIPLSHCGHVCNIDKQSTFDKLMMYLLGNKHHFQKTS